jgi:hypothetical protein
VWWNGKDAWVGRRRRERRRRVRVESWVYSTSPRSNGAILSTDRRAERERGAAAGEEGGGVGRWKKKSGKRQGGGGAEQERRQAVLVWQAHEGVALAPPGPTPA